MLSATKDVLSCKQDLYTRQEHLLIHHAPRRGADRPEQHMIAGHAITAGAVLVTNITREFERVPDLML